MTVDVKSALIAATIVIVIAFALGRYTAPSAEIKDVEISQTDTQKHQDKDVHEVIEETKLPDGTVKTKKTIDTSTKTDTKQESVKTVDKEVIPQGPKVNISAIVANDGFRSLTPIYGASVSKEVLGPITAGVFGLTNGIIGVTIGLNF